MEKLSFKKWVEKYYYKKSGESYYTSKEEVQSGVAPSDLSHFTQKEVEHYFIIYLHSD